MNKRSQVWMTGRHERTRLDGSATFPPEARAETACWAGRRPLVPLQIQAHSSSSCALRPRRPNESRVETGTY